MNYEEFVSAVKEELERKVGGDMRVELHTATKNNGRERIGLIIYDERINITPAIYMETYYNMWESGISMPEIISTILDFYESVRKKEPWEAEIYRDYSMVKGKLACKLINRKKNEKLLESIPHIPYLDLVIVFYVLIEVNSKGITTMMIRNAHMKMWEVETPQLYKDAMGNMEIMLPSCFQTMRSVICDITEADEELQVDVNVRSERMYVLTNQSRNLGAACILYRDNLKKIGEKIGENYYILPSSIHEVIVTPESKSLPRNELEDMVKEINETCVDEEEVLSDRVYYYHCEDQILS